VSKRLGKLDGFNQLLDTIDDRLHGRGLLSGTSETYRPQFHFTPEKNWMNDPNGLVYYKGE
jgi:sucrose-6-phosphate hydrolase SacC (GH32 family)